MGTKDERKFENLHNLIELLLDSVRGLTKSDIARKLNVHRSTASEYLDSLESIKVPVYEISPGRYTIDRDHYEVEISVDMHEALALHLASRLLTTRTDKHNPHAASALRKLGRALEQLAPLISDHMKRSADVLDGDDRRRDPIFIQAIETLTRAWSRQRKVCLTHEMDDGNIREYTFSPYFIEPYAVGRTMHVIGLREPINKIRTFKIERIRTIEILEDAAYEIPNTFDPRAQLRNAWGIWFTENEPITIRLRFSRNVAPRIRETVWHYNQEPLKVLDNGDVIWEANVAEPQEMLPWIRGWGADVEVIEPEKLRAEIIQHVRDLANQYKIMTTKTNPYSFLWAKADKKDSNKIHRLAYHLIDVGQVALAMWNQAIDTETKKHFSEWLNCDEETAGRTLAFLISLHDLGKASPTFQIKVKHQPIITEINKAGFWLPASKPPQSSPHGVVSTWILISLLPQMLKVSESDAKMIAKALGGHHGSWPTPTQMMPAALTLTDKGNNDPSWDTARQELVQAMMEIFKPAPEFSLPQNPEELNVMLTLFSGFTSVADWVGSMTEHFPYEKRINLPLNEYATRSAQAAETALSQLGWFGWRADGKKLTFKEMFPFITEINSVQQRMIEEVDKISQPALLILESPTGSGKTEAALYAADTWLQSQRGHGIYIAMPTQATSNQMYERVTNFLLKRYPTHALNVHLVHGNALLEEKPPVEPQDVYDEDQESTEGGIRAETWFLPRKRTLLAPFGVGTVDQALMSVLQTRHFFVRMFGLQNKVVVFDEVHAYDTYMSELFKQLLRWLRQIGVSVILLSATLPEKTRRELTAAYLGKKEVNLPPAEYPRLTLASKEGIQSIALETPSSRTVQLEWSDVDPAIMIEKLKDALRNGGCAAVICNRVQHAQDLYNEIKRAGLVPDEDLILFHARFPFHWRKEIEDKVLSKFGKSKDGSQNANRPQKSIVVATQVIEQSLDLDFDYMISDLAPIDLLIQRAGRLHRHRQNDSSRPANLKNPTLQIVSPQTEAIPRFGSDEYIYDRSILLKTWLTLKDSTEMNLPTQTTFLIEAVYGEDFEMSDKTLQKEMEEAIEKAEQKERKAIYKATEQFISTPDDKDLLTQRNNNLDEDDPTVNAAFRAMTRLTEPSISLICLHRVNGSLYLDPANFEEPLDSTVKPDRVLVKELIKHGVTLQNYAVVNYFINTKPEIDWKHWKEVAALKYATPIVFEGGRCKLTGTEYTLVLDRQTGLEIQKENQ